MEIGVLGCRGRMGRAILAAIADTLGCALAGGTVKKDDPALGLDLGTLIGGTATGRTATIDVAAVVEQSDVVIDFTAPEATAAHAGLCSATGTPLVIGTTGLNDAQHAVVHAAALRAPIVWSDNMSLGVNLLIGMTRRLAALLDPKSFDIEIVEIHHRHKVDAPSGTALALGRAAADGRGCRLDDVAERGRDGQTGPRVAGQIGFAALRGGDVVGDHTVIFAGAGERLELSHRASNRDIYARGAVHAAQWLVDKPAGLYDMADVLGLDQPSPQNAS